MREILFRGKRIDNGEWIEGHYIFVQDAVSEEFYHCIVKSGGEMCVSELWEYEFIDKDTLSEFTGCYDKNGKKIFEGDFVVVPLSGKPAKGIVEYFKTDICGFVVITQPPYSNYVLIKNYAYEVIGNIHDSPELLEVTE